MCKSLFSPIRYLHHKIKNVLNYNNSSFYDAIKKLTSIENIKITICSKKECGWKELAAKCNIDKNSIIINECYLCSIWCCSYLTITIYDSINNFFVKEEKVLTFSNEAIELYDYAKSLAYSYDNWPNDLPLPQDENNHEIVEATNICAIIAIDVLLLHEMSHIYLKHQKGAGLEQEFQADIQAKNWMINDNNKDELCLQLAIMSAFFTLILMDETAQNDKSYHPSSFKRLMNVLESFNINDNDILWAIACIIFGIWDKSFNSILFEFRNTEEKTYKERFKCLLCEARKQI